MSDVSDAGLVALGWLLGVLSQGMERRRQDYLEKRRVLTRLDRILTTTAIEVAIVRELGTSRALAQPPSLPEDYDRVADQLGDWEARRGQSEIHAGLITLKRLITLAAEGYASIESAAKEPTGEIPEPLLTLYEGEIRAVKELTWKLIGGLQKARIGPLRRLLRRISQRQVEEKVLNLGQDEKT